MANMEDRIDSFIAENGLDENAKDAVIELVNGCFTDYISHMAKEWLKNPVDNKSKKNITKSKKAKFEDPTAAESIDDLMNCTTAILTEYCKNNKLKVGGTKTDLSGRVWRHIQGESSDEDTKNTKKSSKDSKDLKSKKEIHSCFACNSKGAPCGLSATEEYSGHWFCFHHIDSAEELISAKKSSDSESESTTKSTKTAKTAKTAKTTKTTKTPKTAKSKKSGGSESSEHDDDELNSE
jgi:hypothetical protein